MRVGGREGVCVIDVVTVVIVFDIVVVVGDSGAVAVFQRTGFSTRRHVGYCTYGEGGCRDAKTLLVK